MKKNQKILIVLIVAIVFALIAGYAIISFLTPHRTTIYVFKSSYSIGTQLTSDMLVPVQVDTDMLVAGRNTNVNEKFITSETLKSVIESGDSLKISVGEGTPLMKSLLSISGGNSIIMSMSPSSIAVTVNVDNTTGVTRDMYPGASVNVYVTSYSGGTFLLFENMRILDIQRKGDGGALASVTLEVTNEEAVRLINSTKNGSIQLGLINPNGYQYESGTSDILVNPEAQSSNEEEEESESLIQPEENVETLEEETAATNDGDGFLIEPEQ